MKPLPKSSPKSSPNSSLLLRIVIVLTLASLSLGLNAAFILGPPPALHQGAAFTSTREPAVTAALDFTPAFTIYLPYGSRGPNPGPEPGATSCNPSGGAGGLAPGIHQTTVGPLAATVVVGQGYKPKTPTYLVFYLHGDEGNYSAFQNAAHPVTKLVNEKGWILISPRSPEPQTRWWKDPDPQVGALAEVFADMFSRYNLCRNTILGGTISGGSIFWSKNFFPEQGETYPAHILLMCGSGRFDKTKNNDVPVIDKIKALGQKSKIVARTSLKFTYGSEDHLYSQIQQGITVYRQAGFAVIKNELPGLGHCVPNTTTRFRDFLKTKAADLGLN